MVYLQLDCRGNDVIVLLFYWGEYGGYGGSRKMGQLHLDKI